MFALLILLSIQLGTNTGYAQKDQAAGDAPKQVQGAKWPVVLSNAVCEWDASRWVIGFDYEFVKGSPEPKWLYRLTLNGIGKFSGALPGRSLPSKGTAEIVVPHRLENPPTEGLELTFTARGPYGKPANTPLSKAVTAKLKPLKESNVFAEFTASDLAAQMPPGEHKRLGRKRIRVKGVVKHVNQITHQILLDSDSPRPIVCYMKDPIRQKFPKGKEIFIEGFVATSAPTVIFMRVCNVAQPKKAAPKIAVAKFPKPQLVRYTFNVSATDSVPKVASNQQPRLSTAEKATPQNPVQRNWPVVLSNVVCEWDMDRWVIKVDYQFAEGVADRKLFYHVKSERKGVFFKAVHGTRMPVSGTIESVSWHRTERPPTEGLKITLKSWRSYSSGPGMQQLSAPVVAKLKPLKKFDVFAEYSAKELLEQLARTEKKLARKLIRVTGPVKGVFSTGDIVVLKPESSTVSIMCQFDAALRKRPAKGETIAIEGIINSHSAKVVGMYGCQIVQPTKPAPKISIEQFPEAGPIPQPQVTVTPKGKPAAPGTSIAANRSTKPSAKPPVGVPAKPKPNTTSKPMPQPPTKPAPKVAAKPSPKPLADVPKKPNPQPAESKPQVASKMKPKNPAGKGTESKTELAAIPKIKIPDPAELPKPAPIEMTDAEFAAFLKEVNAPTSEVKPVRIAEIKDLKSPIGKCAISDDGRRLITIDKDKESAVCRVWNVETGKPICTLNQKLVAANDRVPFISLSCELGITRDGRYGIVSDGSSNVYVFDTSTGEVKMTHDAIASFSRQMAESRPGRVLPHNRTVFDVSADGKWLAMGARYGGLHRYPLLGGLGNTFPTIGNVRSVSMVADGKFAAFVGGEPSIVEFPKPDTEISREETRRLYRLFAIKGSGLYHAVVGDGYLAFYGSKKLDLIVNPSTANPADYRHFILTTPFPIEDCTITKDHLVVAGGGQIQFRPLASPESPIVVRFGPMSMLNALRGAVVLTKKDLDHLSGSKPIGSPTLARSGEYVAFHSNSTKISVAVYKFPKVDQTGLAKLRTAVKRARRAQDTAFLNRVSRAYAKDIEPFAGSAYPTKYQEFVDAMNFGDLPDVVESQLEALLKKDRKSAPATLALARMYHSRAWAARGRGFANAVTEEGWKGFHKWINESERLLDRFIPDENTPGEFYRVLVDTARAQGWKAQQVDRYINTMMKHTPEYLPAHYAVAVMRLPRWHGEPGDSMDYAKTVADKLGGQKGDALYAQIAGEMERWRRKGFTSHEWIDSLKVDLNRMQRGADSLVKQDPKNQKFHQLRILAAYFREDRSATRDAVDAYTEAFPPTQQKWRVSTRFLEIVAWLNIT